MSPRSDRTPPRSRTATASKRPTTARRKPASKAVPQATGPSPDAARDATGADVADHGPHLRGTAGVSARASKSGAESDVPAEKQTPASHVARSAKTEPARQVRQVCKLSEQEYGQLSVLKKRSRNLARPMKRGELLRVGLQLLAALDDAALFDALDRAALPRRASVSP